jgi:hypothetical protein
MSEGKGERLPHLILCLQGKGQAGAGLSFPASLSKGDGQHDEEESIKQESLVESGPEGIEICDGAALRGKMN